MNHGGGTTSSPRTGTGLASRDQAWQACFSIDQPNTHARPRESRRKTHPPRCACRDGAGTLKFWQAWAVIALGLTFPALMVICYYKRDPQLIERRLLKKESVPEQKNIMKLGALIYFPALALPGLDQRFGWSHEWLAAVPLWLTVVSLILVLGCHLMFFWVVSVNRYAARIIQVEASQTVADTGPYRLVRHPMYSASVVSTFCIPLALGSFVALPVYLLWNPLIVYRLLNEEEILRRDLPGYVDYCQRMRYRLIPLVW